MRTILLGIVLLAATPVYGQDPAPQPEVPTLSREDTLEQENIRLLAMISNLQKELSEVRIQLQNAQIQRRAETFIQKISKDHPNFEVDPNTLELKPKESKK